MWLVEAALPVHTQRWTEEEGRWEFTGKMVVRPLQVEHWMEQGFSRERAQELYAEATAYTVRTLGEHVYRYHERMDEYWFNVPQGRTENDLGEELIATGYYRYVCPNWWAAPAGLNATFDDCPDDPLLSNQWHHTRIESCAGWQIHTAGHDDVVIGFVDNGLSISHEDVSNLNQYRRTGYKAEQHCWESSTCSIEEAGSPWHGTKVLGAGAATGNNEAGVSGIGWTLRHRMLTGVGELETCLDSMWVSATAGDRVICSTAGFDFSDPDIWLLFNDLTESMIVGDAFDPVPLVFQAAGNTPDGEYDPFPYMTIVGGTQQNDARWLGQIFGSPVGDFIDIMAPANEIYSTLGNSQYGATNGTSYATPQVAGLAALIWSFDPDLDREDVLDFLYRGCDPIVDYDPDLHGAGRINVFNSLALASGTLWTRDPYPGEAGTTNSFKAAGADEGTRVWFFYGDGTGQTQVTVGNCTITLDIANPTLIPAESAVATSNGAAIIDQAVSGSWSQETVWLQVVEEDGCRKSNVVVFTFE